MFNLNRTNQNEYHYGLYQEQLQQIKKNSLLYSNNPELVIKYFSINLALSNNIDQVDVLFPQNVPSSADDIGDLPKNEQDFQASQSNTIHGTGMFDKYQNFTYDIFEFTPILEMSPFTYSPNSDTNNGTSGSLSLMTIDKPKVGDLFTYYNKVDKSGKSIVDQTEIFQVSSVQMQRTSNNILPIYQLEFKTANILYKSLKKFSIHDIFFYDNLQNNFTSSKCWDAYQNVTNDNKNFKLITKNYNKYKSRYEFNTVSFNEETKKPFIDKKIPLIFNNLIKRIQNSSYNQNRFDIVKNISANISVQTFLNIGDVSKKWEVLLLQIKKLSDTTDTQTTPDATDNKVLINLKKIFTGNTGNTTFLIKNILYLYLFYYFLYKDCKENILYLKIQNYIIPEDLELFLNPDTDSEAFEKVFEKYQTDNIIGFIDKDLQSNTFLIIDDLKFIMNLPIYKNGYSEEKLPLNKVQTVIQNNFNIYNLLFKYLNNIYKIAYCDKKYIKFPEMLNNEKSNFTKDTKIPKVNYYNLFNCNKSIDQLYNASGKSIDTSGCFYWNDDGIIIDYNKKIILPIGDLGLPIALSFQYGVQYRDIYNPDTKGNLNDRSK